MKHEEGSGQLAIYSTMPSADKSMFALMFVPAILV
jgi:hypothetical protein